MTNPLDKLVEIPYSNENLNQNRKLKVNNDGEKSLIQRKRSLAHNSDDEVSDKLQFLYILLI